MNDSISEIVDAIVGEYYTYLSEFERSSTEMEKSIAVLKVKAQELQANTELAERYFKFQMEERERLFQSASQVLEKAMKQGNVEFAQIALKVIEIVHQKSPFSF